MRALLDVNVLIALLDADHLNHDIAWRWLRENIEYGWATCPITENGCLRIMSQPAYPNHLPMRVVVERLREATDAEYHQFWPDSLTILNPVAVNWRQVIGPKQVTDVYLLALAVACDGRFVTFDNRISLQSVVGATDQHFCKI